MILFLVAGLIVIVIVIVIGFVIVIVVVFGDFNVRAFPEGPCLRSNL